MTFSPVSTVAVGVGDTNLYPLAAEPPPLLILKSNRLPETIKMNCSVMFIKTTDAGSSDGSAWLKGTGILQMLFFRGESQFNFSYF